MTNWTDDEVAKLKELAPSVEYKEIAVMLGRSISSICTKVKRMKDGRLLPQGEKRVIRVVPASERAPRKDNDPIFNAISTLNALEALTLGGKLKTFDEHDDECECAYICGDPTKQAEIYCPEPAIPGSSWCRTHHKRVFNPSEVRLARPKAFVPKVEALVDA